MEIRITIPEAEEIIYEYLDKKGTEFIKNLGEKNTPEQWVKFDEDNSCFVAAVIPAP